MVIGTRGKGSTVRRKGFVVSNHLSGPELKPPGGDGRLDFTDLFAFQSPNDPSRCVLIMDLNPFAPTMGEGLHPDAVYRINIDNDGDLQPMSPSASCSPHPTTVGASRRSRREITWRCVGVHASQPWADSANAGRAAPARTGRYASARSMSPPRRFVAQGRPHAAVTTLRAFWRRPLTLSDLGERFFGLALSARTVLAPDAHPPGGGEGVDGSALSAPIAAGAGAEARDIPLPPFSG